jgi:cysteine synthase
MLESLGAEVVIVPQVAGEPGQVTGPDIAAAARVAETIADVRNGFYVDQFHALEGKLAHETGTAQEPLTRPVDLSTVGPPASARVARSLASRGLCEGTTRG